MTYEYGGNDPEFDSVTTDSADIGDTATVTIGTDGEVRIPDDVELFFGDGDDFSIVHDTGITNLVLQEDGNPRWEFNTNKNLKSRTNGADLDLDGNDIINHGVDKYQTQDVRNISSPAQGHVAYHDGSGGNTEGLAAYNGTDWISQVDGTTIS